MGYGGSDVYGLIHADLGVGANVLFWHGQPRPIDFDGSGFGYWMYDVAVALAHLAGSTEYYRYRDALLEGYHLKAESLNRKMVQTMVQGATFVIRYVEGIS